MHVELDLDSKPTELLTWHVLRGSAGDIVDASARDAAGAIDVQISSEHAEVDVRLARAPSGHVHLAYDVLAVTSLADPLAVLVKGDRFHGAGERLIALPAAIEDTTLPITVDIDVAPLEADRAASSFGIGRRRTADFHPRALRYAIFAAGSHDDLVMDTIDGHDEASWLGVASFDLRETVVELAQERTILAGVLGGRSLLPDIAWTYIFETTSQRGTDAFEITPRIHSMFVQLGSTDPMTVPLRMALARPLARRWIGDAVRLTPTGHPPDLAWFDDGMAEYLSLRALARTGVISPDDWAGVLRSELAVLATSGDAGKSNVEVAARVSNDPDARTVLMMRGALFAARESVVISTRTKGAETMETVLARLLERARPKHFGGFEPLTTAIFLEELSKDDPDAAKSFDALVLRGKPITLPKGALGVCFRAGTGEYVAFDAGYDVEATRRDPDHHIVGLRPDGPAAKAGLAPDDTVEEVVAGQGDPSAPVKVTVTRAGKKVVISYSPRGRKGKGQTWTRTAPVFPLPQCGLPP